MLVRRCNVDTRALLLFQDAILCGLFRVLRLLPDAVSFAWCAGVSTVFIGIMPPCLLCIVQLASRCMCV